jgi:hypothetical protein
MVINKEGKAGTLSKDEFTVLKSLVEDFGANVITAKVGKICFKTAAAYEHETPGSTIGKAWASLSAKIVAQLSGSGKGLIGSENFEFLTGLVDTYGPELVLAKVAKIASKTKTAA